MGPIMHSLFVLRFELLFTAATGYAAGRLSGLCVGGKTMKDPSHLANWLGKAR